MDNSKIQPHEKLKMTPYELAQYILNEDAFSQWMGIRLIEVREKYCLIEMPIKKRIQVTAVNALIDFKDVFMIIG